jgi:hypothetical protein
MTHVHKRFTDDQLRSLFRAYDDGQIDRGRLSGQGPFDPHEGLPKNRVRAGEVQPGEALGFPAEDGSAAQTDARLPEEEGVQFLRIQTEASAVDEGEICAFGFIHAERGKPLVKKADREVGPGFQIFKKLLEPWPASAVGGLHGRQAEGVGEVESGRGQFPAEPIAQNPVRNDRERSRQAGDVERFARGAEGDRPGGGFGVEGGQGNMAVSAEDQVAMDFVGDDDQVAGQADFGQSPQLFLRPNPADGIVRTANDDHFRPVVDLPDKIVEIHAPSPAFETKGISDQAPAG